jgi:hypothetical protein
MTPPAAKVDPPWYKPYNIPRCLVPVDFFQCTCGSDVWRSADGLVREYGEGAYHYCPLEEEGAEPESLHDLADSLAQAQEDRREAEYARAIQEAREADNEADASRGPFGDDDALRDL